MAGDRVKRASGLAHAGGLNRPGFDANSEILHLITSRPNSPTATPSLGRTIQRLIPHARDRSSHCTVRKTFAPQLNNRLFYAR